MVHDWGARLPRVPGEVDLEVVLGEATPPARVVQRPERELVDLGSAELGGLSRRLDVVEDHEEVVGEVGVSTSHGPRREKVADQRVWRGGDG
jgi:hypothetical protein